MHSSIQLQPMPGNDAQLTPPTQNHHGAHSHTAAPWADKGLNAPLAVKQLCTLALGTPAPPCLPGKLPLRHRPSAAPAPGPWPGAGAVGHMHPSQPPGKHSSALMSKQHLSCKHAPSNTPPAAAVAVMITAAVHSMHRFALTHTMHTSTRQRALLRTHTH